MDIYKFIENLKKYLKATFNYEVPNNAIRIYLDNEMYYDYAYLSRKLYMYERGKKSEIGCWSDIKNANLNFAMLLRNHFCGQLYDKVPNALEDCTSLESLSKILNKYFDEQYYSVGCLAEGKLSIVKDDNYTIWYSKGEKKHMVAKDSDCEYIFTRFFNEIMYLEKLMNNLRDHEHIFGEEFTDGEVMELIEF